MRCVFSQNQGVVDRGKETWPAATAIEFCFTAKECCTGQRINEMAWSFLVQMRAGEGFFGALVKGDSLLFRREHFPSKPAPESLRLAVVSGKARNFAAIFEQHDCRRNGNRGLQRDVVRCVAVGDDQ